MATHIPERLVGERVVLRRHTLEDAPALVEAITASVDHLRPWMAWIRYEPQSGAQRREMIAEWIGEWDAATTFPVAMVDPADEARIIGGCGLHRRGEPNQIEIGYWVHADFAGRGVASDAARLLTNAGLIVDGIDEVLICHDVANIASGRVPRKLGFSHIEERRVAITAPGERGVHWKWRMTAADWTHRP